MHEVRVGPRPIQPFEQLLGEAAIRSLERDAVDIRERLGANVVWNVNSTAAGGGVAEMLQSLIRYARGQEVNIRWQVLDAPPEFFHVTKRIHNALHASVGDGSPLGPEQAALYEAVLRENEVVLQAVLRPGDVVICHDPQTAGLVPPLMQLGARVAWRCHIGHESHDNEEVDRGWDFLRPYLEDVPLAVFSRAAYAPPWLRGKRTLVLPPNIDPFSAKNQDLSEATVRSILVGVGLIEGPRDPADSCYRRDDGSVGRVDREADVVRLGRPPSWDTPLVTQVSRWDAMKDPIGVLRGFARLVDPVAPRGAHLVLAGPGVHSVSDDPEGAKVFGELQEVWLGMSDPVRHCVHLAMLPTADAEENAAIVNALQRHSAVIAQKSLAEGFGLTVTEAMWKRRPVVASAVGGILDQIRDGVDGLLVYDPTDEVEFAGALRRVLLDEALGRALGAAAWERVRDNYLSVRALERWAELLRQMLA